MIEVIGAHNSLYGREGVIQFKVVHTPCIAMAAYPLQLAQLGASLAADAMLAPIKMSIGTDNVAVTRQNKGVFRHATDHP